MDRRPEHWRLDRKVPLVLILAIALQTLAVVWGAATLSARVEVLEKQATAIAPLAEKVIRLETRLEAIQQGIAEIKTLIRTRQAGVPPM